LIKYLVLAPLVVF